jgi:hypothetical protein
METKYYDISGFNIPFVCKVSIFHNPYGNYKTTTLSFGGPGTYCMTISIDDMEPGIAYIANVDYNEKCTKSHQLELHKGTYRLVKTALWVTRLLYPDTRKFTFTDDSHIYCVKGSKEYKADLASDYIFKYNETWYEKNFAARLPEPFYSRYKETIPVLDAPLQSIDTTSQSYLNPFSDIYNASSTPRDFINNMRKTYKNAYCITVGPWLHNYLISLRVDIPDKYKSQWFINADDVHEVPGFTIKTVTGQPRYGGGRRYTRKHRTLITYQHKGRIVVGCDPDDA